MGDEQGRTQDQITADLLVERLTGQISAAAVPVEVHLVMTDGALMGSDPGPAWIPGQGPLPAETARQWLTDPEAEVFLRRLFTRPEDGHLVSMDSRNRVFPPLLRRMLLLRDDACRTPWCEAGSGGLAVTTPTGHRYARDAVPLLPTVSGSTAPPGPPDHRPHPRAVGVAEARLERCLQEHRPAVRLARLAMATATGRSGPLPVSAARRILDSRTKLATSCPATSRPARPTPPLPSRGGP